MRNIQALQSALSDAARKGTVIRNVADTTDPPSISRSGRSICVWTGDQLRDRRRTAPPPPPPTRGAHGHRPARRQRLRVRQPDGSPIHPDLIIQTFERAVAKRRVPRIRLHDLRHTHVTILLNRTCTQRSSANA